MEYIEPSYPITLPTEPTTATATTPSTYVTEEDDDDATTQPIGTTTDDGDHYSSGDYYSSGDHETGITPQTTGTTPTMPTTTEVVSPSEQCDKIRGGVLAKFNDYFVMFQYDIPPPRMNDLYNLLKLIESLDKSFSMLKMTPFFKGPEKGFYYNQLGKQAVMKVSTKTKVDIKVIPILHSID